MRKASYTDSELVDAVASSGSFHQVISKLGLIQAGGTQDNLKKKCVRLGISTEHFHGQGWTKGRTFPEKKLRTLKKHLRQGSVVNTHALRLLLIDTGTREAKCERCQGVEWNGEVMPLELHHIDGDRTNNLTENLLILCPNCHAQTDNHAGKGRRKSMLDS